MVVMLAFSLVVGVQAYTAIDFDGNWELLTQQGTLSIQLGQGCEWLQPWINVDLLSGSANTAILSQNDIDAPTRQCAIAITGLLSPDGCFVNPDGDCDVATDPGA